MFYKFMRAIGRPFFYLFIGRTKIIGKENIALIDEGSAIICANHMSNWDPVILGDTFPRPINFMAKKALFKNKLMAKFMYAGGAFPVDRDTNDIAAIKQALKILKSEEILGIFPEGQRNRDGYVHKFKDGLPLIAHKTKATVLPVGIKRRVGLFKRPIVEIGKPVDFSEFYSQKATSDIYNQMNDILHREVSRLVYGEKING